MPAATDRPPLTRDAIVAAARERIRAHGLDAFSLRPLAADLGVSAPALYTHFADKRELLRAVAAGEFDQLVATYRAVELADPLARIRFHSRAYVEHARANPELFAVMFLFPPAQAMGDEVAAAALDAATDAFTWATAAVDDAIAAGLLVTDDPLLLSLTLWAGAHGVATVLQLGFGLPADLEDRMVDDITDRILAGYAPR